MPSVPVNQQAIANQGQSPIDTPSDSYAMMALAEMHKQGRFASKPAAPKLPKPRIVK